MPISRRYMRTGSLVLSLTSVVEIEIGEVLAFFGLLFEIEFGFFEDLDAGGVEIGQSRSSNSRPDGKSSASRSLTSSYRTKPFFFAGRP